MTAYRVFVNSQGVASLEIEAKESVSEEEPANDFINDTWFEMSYNQFKPRSDWYDNELTEYELFLSEFQL
jgi:hypothetical protein